MNLDLLRGNRNLLFWALHTLGWSAYGLAQYVGSAVYGKEPGYVQVIAIAAAAASCCRRRSARVPQALVGRPARDADRRADHLLAGGARLARDHQHGLHEHREARMGDGTGRARSRSSSARCRSMALLLCWTGLYFGVKFYETLQLEREATLAASALAQEAQLKMLRYQLNPHFLFNTLNAISTLVLDGQNRTANLAVSRLSEFLRYTLDQDPMKKVTLRQELDALNLYLGIEKLRFGDRLRLEFDVDERAESALVPSLLLQPLVENAMKYAISPREEGGSVTIIAGIESGALRLAVQDDGPGLPAVAPAANGRGVGLRNTRDRLKVLYGDAHRIDVGRRRAGTARRDAPAAGNLSRCSR